MRKELKKIQIYDTINDVVYALKEFMQTISLETNVSLKISVVQNDKEELEFIVDKHGINRENKKMNRNKTMMNELQETKDNTVNTEFQKQKACIQPLPANLLSSAKQIIDFYQVTVNDAHEPHYNCSTTKIGKLLTLAAWIYAISCCENNHKLFNENIISKKCGSTFEGLTLMLCNKDFTIGKDIGDSVPDDKMANLNIFKNNDLNCLLLFIFQNFGAYESYILGNYINEYKPTSNDSIIISIDDFLAEYNANEKKYIEKLQSNSLNDKYKLSSLGSYVNKWKIKQNESDEHE